MDSNTGTDPRGASDPRGPYVTFFHEFMHAIDDVRIMLEGSANDAITSLGIDISANPDADVIGGVTNNTVGGYGYGHRPDSDKLADEMFEEMVK